MNYGQIIKQAWQIIKTTRLLWIFLGIDFFQSFLNFRISDSLAIEYFSLLLYFLSIFLGLLSDYGMILTSEKCIQGETLGFISVWSEFKGQLGRFILLSITLILPTGIIFLCSAGSLGLMSVITNLSISDRGFGFFLIILISGIFSTPIYFFGYYGLIVHKLGVLKSIGHAIYVFGLNWFKCTLLIVCLQIPVLLFDLIVCLVLYLNKSPLSYNTFLQTLSIFPINLCNKAIAFVVHMFSSVSFLVAYHQFIQKYDYPALKPVSLKS